MTGEMNFWDVGVWQFVLTLSILFGAMLLANLLRRVIPFLRRSLIPSAVLGGFLLLVLNELFKLIFKQSMFQIVTLEALTYHGLGLGFVALAWRQEDKMKGKKARRDIFNTSTVVVGSYLIQAVLGLAITIALYYIMNSYAAGGLLLPMGYGQGPGQAYNWGSIYQSYTEYPAFENGASFGLTIAAMGFVVACIGGVIHVNRLRRKGDPSAQILNADEMEDLSAEKITDKGEIPMSESMDKLTVEFGLVFITYIISYGFMYLITIFLDKAGGFMVNTVKSLVWGFNFLVGTAVTSLLKVVLKKLKGVGVIKREYTNKFMLNRISGLMFDIMVVASIAAINLSAFKHKEFVIPLILICAVGALSTYFYNRYICRRLFPNYSDEAFLSLYGMNTGTASTGIILLREIDPMFKTPASHNLIYQSLWSIVLGAPMLLLMGFGARSTMWTWIVFGVLAALFVVIYLVQLAIAKKIAKGK